MNTENVQKLLDNYIENYETLNDPEHHEIYKWTAVNHFQRHWDLDEPAFGEMFKRAMGKSENIIDNSIVQPSNGIVFLCKQDKDTEEAVRAEFKKLLAPDGGDIKYRQSKIDAFIDTINGMLQKAAPGKWKYDQDRRAVIMYLSFIAPADNFMFKSTEAKSFAECYEYGDDIGSGQTFRLDNYYRMCQELVEEIEQNDTLCDLLNDRLQYEAEIDDEKEFPVTDLEGKLNILAYDIMYCAHTYNLYYDMTIRKKAKANSPEQRRQQMAEKRNELTGRRDELNILLEQVSGKKEEIKYPDIVGVPVKNIKYGTGTITEHQGRYLTVEFPVGVKKFAVPDVFAKGFLKIDNQDVVTISKELAELIAEEEKYAREIRGINAELVRLEE